MGGHSLTWTWRRCLSVIEGHLLKSKEDILTAPIWSTAQCIKTMVCVCLSVCVGGWEEGIKGWHYFRRELPSLPPFKPCTHTPQPTHRVWLAQDEGKKSLRSQYIWLCNFFITPPCTHTPVYTCLHRLNIHSWLAGVIWTNEVLSSGFI